MVYEKNIAPGGGGVEYTGFQSGSFMYMKQCAVMSMAVPQKTYGFTLLELAIVLTITAFLIGGVLFGKDLIQAANVRSTIAQKEKFDTATMAFRNKYSGLPGDLKDATAKGFDHDGNGDELIGMNDDYLTACAGRTRMGWNCGGVILSVYTEMGEYWVQLSKARLIDGTYTLSDHPNSDGDYFSGKAGINFPKSKMDAMGFSQPSGFGWWLASDTIYFDDNAWTGGFMTGKHVFFLTGFIGWDDIGQAQLRILDAYAIDTKLDDGMPTSGNVRATENQSSEFGGAKEGSEYSKGSIYSGANLTSCMDVGVSPAQYNITSPEEGSDCNARACSRCGLLIGASF